MACLTRSARHFIDYLLSRWIIYAIRNHGADWDVAIVNHPLIHRFI